MRTNVRTAPERLHALLVVLAAVLAVLSASVRAPSVMLRHVAVASVLGPREPGTETPKLVERSELGRVPTARPSGAEPPRPASNDGALAAWAPPDAPARPSASTERLLDAPRRAPGTWTKPARSRAELMVFLN